MKHNDLSSQVVPRLALVFEGALGFADRAALRQFEKDLKRKHLDWAASRWVLDPTMMLKIWDVTKRLSFNLDIVTFLADGSEFFGEALAIRLQDVYDLPIHGVIATTEDKLSRKIAYMPDLAKIYDPDRLRSLRWGSKGYHLTDLNQLGE